MAEVIIVGAGGHGQVVADILRLSRPGHHVVGYVDDNAALWGTDVSGDPVLGGVDALARIQHDCVIVAIGGNRVRQQIVLKLDAMGEVLVSAIHPSAIVGRGAVIETGCMICAGAIVGVGSQVSRGAIINTCASVDHHSAVGACAHVAPGAHTGGNVHIGEGAFVGVGASIIPGVQVGAWSIVGAGAAVTRDVPPGTTVVGVPARPIRP